MLVLMNDSWGWALPMVSGRIWTVSAIAMRRLKSGKSGRFKTSRPKASPRALHRRSAVAPVWEGAIGKRDDADRLMLRRWPLSDLYSRFVQWLPLPRSGTWAAHTDHLYLVGTLFELKRSISCWLSVWNTLVVFPRNPETFLEFWAKVF